MNMFITWIVVIITGVSTYVRADQIVYIMCSFVYTSYTAINLGVGWGRKE